MNPLTNIKNLNKLNENEIRSGNVGTKTSWHNQYRDSAWVFFGGMPFELTEGDIIIIFSQYGEIVNINLIRDKKTGKSKGFGFVCYENQLSTDLAVDNFNGTKILGRIIKVDHVANYKPPKDSDEADEITKFLREEGCSSKTVIEKKDKLEQDKTELIKNVKQEPPSVRHDRDKQYESRDRYDKDKYNNDRYKYDNEKYKSSSKNNRDNDKYNEKYREDNRYRNDEKYRNDDRYKSHKKDRDKSRSKSRSRSPKSHKKKSHKHRD